MNAFSPPKLNTGKGIQSLNQTVRTYWRQGFTLMEMSLVMLIMVLVIGIAAYSFGGVSGEEILRRPAAEFRKVVLEAVRRAALYEQPQVIGFDVQGFLLRQRNRELKEDPLSFTETPTPAEQWVWQRRGVLPDGMRMMLRRFGQLQFQPAAGQFLTIAPGGLCEPLTVRFEDTQDGAWLEITLDPLSGGVADEAMHVEGGKL